MNTIAKKYHVRVLDQEYVIMSDESQEHVTQVAQRVEQLMRDMSLKTRGVLDVKKTAIFAALKLASDALKQEQYAVLHQQKVERVIQLIESQM